MLTRIPKSSATRIYRSRDEFRLDGRFRGQRGEIGKHIATRADHLSKGRARCQSQQTTIRLLRRCIGSLQSASSNADA
jgi:hypothetical protein